VPVTELSNDGVIKYSLEEYMEIENSLLNSKPATTKAEPEEELNIVMKIQENTPETNTFATQNVSPLEMTIDETLKMRADERRRKLKEFNYKFNSSSKIDELEKIPAYKRTGIDLTPNQSANPTSRMSIGIDSNDDLQLRSNNSFLHDNVD
jgi:cell division protein FtsZ